jgi:hypothetical protein
MKRKAYSWCVRFTSNGSELIFHPAANFTTQIGGLLKMDRQSLIREALPLIGCTSLNEVKPILDVRY